MRGSVRQAIVVNVAVLAVAVPLAVAQAAAPTSEKCPVQAPPRAPVADFNGDGRSDIAVWRPATATWWILRPNGQVAFERFGEPGDRPVPADYDGDGRTDFAVFTPESAVWTIKRSSDGERQTVQVGGPGQGNQPTAGYWDKDADADPAAYIQGGKWYIHRSCDQHYYREEEQFGMVGDLPVPHDYDGDGAVDKAVFTPPTAQWTIQPTVGGGDLYRWFGWATDQRVPADYDGDGTADLAVVRIQSGVMWWYVQPSPGDQGFWGTPFGRSGDQPVPADYDGDGMTDVGVFRVQPNGTGQWIWRSSDGGPEQYVNFGSATDLPIPATYLP